MIKDAAIERGERAEMEAWGSVWEGAPAQLRDALSMSCQRAEGAMAFHASGFPWWFFNRIVGLGVYEAVDDAWLEAELAEFAKAGAPYGVSLCPGQTALAQRLEAQGLHLGTTHAKMALSAEKVRSADGAADIREVDSGDSKLFAETVVGGFGVPAALAGLFEPLPGRENWHTYLGFEDGVPVGTGALYVSGDAAWLGFGSTLPAHRGRGLHGAMMTHRMAEGRTLGCQWLVTETDKPKGDEPSPSFHNMLRRGFELAYERPNYVMTPSG